MDNNTVLVDWGALMMPIEGTAHLYLALNSHCIDTPDDAFEGGDHRFGFEGGDNQLGLSRYETNTAFEDEFWEDAGFYPILRLFGPLLVVVINSMDGLTVASSY